MDRNRQTEMNDNLRYILALDIGGTKTGFGIISYDLTKFHFTMLHKREIVTLEQNRKVTTQLELELFFDRLAKEILLVEEEATKHNWKLQPHIGVGSPGHINKGVIARGTTPQIGTAFDGVNIEKKIRDSIARVNPRKKFEVVAHNDALAQMSYGLHELFKQEALAQELSGQRVCYIGPGTGLGGGFAQLTPDCGRLGRPILNFFTDGHIGDMIIGQKENGEPLQAESDGISGMFIAKRTSGLTGKDVSVKLAEYTALTEEMGKNLGIIIELIFKGEVRKARETTQWTPMDCQMVRGIRYYVIGGSIGSNGEMGRRIRDAAMRYLKNRLGPDQQIKLLPIVADSCDAGVMGAASFVL